MRLKLFLMLSLMDRSSPGTSAVLKCLQFSEESSYKGISSAAHEASDGMWPYVSPFENALPSFPAVGEPRVDVSPVSDKENKVLEGP